MRKGRPGEDGHDDKGDDDEVVDVVDDNDDDDDEVELRMKMVVDQLRKKEMPGAESFRGAK